MRHHVWAFAGGWLPRHREHSGVALATMVPVNIAPASVAVNPRPRVSAVSTATGSPIEVVLHDATVRLPAGFDPAELRSIVQILAALR